jgi:hypothetical protein
MSLDGTFRRLSQELSAARSAGERRDVLAQYSDLLAQLSPKGQERLLALAQDISEDAPEEKA